MLEPVAREVLDFVEFVRARSRASDHDLMRAQQASLSAIWDNTDDEVWN